MMSYFRGNIGTGGNSFYYDGRDLWIYFARNSIKIEKADIADLEGILVTIRNTNGTNEKKQG